MSQYLDGGHNSDSISGGIVVDAAKLFPGISASHITESGFSFDFIDIFHIQNQAVKPHEGHTVQQ